MDTPDFGHSFLPIIEQALTDHAGLECLRFRSEVYTYAEVDRLSAQIANRLLGSGFRPGMKGAIYSLNSALSFIATLGLLRAGGVWIPINPRNSPRDNVAVLRQFRCQVLFFQTEFRETVEGLLASDRAPDICVGLDGALAACPMLEAWIAQSSTSSPGVVPGPMDLITIPLTGGTTGLPKGAMLSNRNFCALERATRDMYRGRRPAILCAAPMTHVGGRIALCGLSSGARYVILEQVDPQLILSTIASQRITDFFLPPTAIYALLDQPNVGDVDLSSLVRISYGSAPISTERLKQALRIFGPVMRGGFGQTECPMFIAQLHPHEHYVNGDITGAIASDQRLRSVGRATPVSEIAILDDEGNELPVGEPGEIAVKGPMVFEGYYENPEETARVRKCGWHLTGDIGYLDDAGYLYIVDRKKDMIITGGFNVYSTEVEQCLLGIEGVELAAVIGVPDDKWGEAVAAYVKVAPGSTLTESDLISLAKREIGGVKAPKRVTLVDDLPRTPIGKIDKKPLRYAAWGGIERKI